MYLKRKGAVGGIWDQWEEDRGEGGWLSKQAEELQDRAPEPAAPPPPSRPDVSAEAPWGEPGPAADPAEWEQLMAKQRQQQQLLLLGGALLVAWYMFVRKPKAARRRRKRR